MASVSGTTFFGGKVPPPPTAAATAPVAQGAGGSGVLDRLKQDLNKRVTNTENVADKYAAGKTGVLGGALQLAGQATGFLGDAATEAIKTVTPQPVKDAAKGAIAAAANTAPAKDAIYAYQGWKQAHPEAAANLEAIASIASVLPTGKAAQLGTEAASKFGTKAVEGSAGILTTTGRAVSGTGEAVYKSAITPTVHEAEKILSYDAKNPFLTRASNRLAGEATAGKPVTRADTALEYALTGRQKDVGVQAAREADKLYTKTIAPAVKASTARISKDDLFQPILNRIADTAEPGRQNAFIDAFDAIKHDYKDHTDFSLEEAQKIKRGLDEFTPDKVFKGKSVANEYKTLKADMANAIRQKTYEALSDENIKKSYLDYGNLAELRKIGVKAITDASSKGGFGSFWSGMWDAATTPVRTVGGQILYRVGNKLEFLADRKTKTFGEYLEKHGYHRPNSSASLPLSTPQSGSEQQQ